jgi:sporulation integral membrane protein YtvI
LTSAVVLILLFTLISSLFYLAISRLIGELGDLLARLAEDPELIGNTLSSLVDRVTGNGSHFSFLQSIFESESLKSLGIDLSGLLRDAIGSMISSLTSALPVAAISVLKAIPSWLLFMIVLLIAAYYFSSDGDSVGRGLSSVLPTKWQAKLPVIKEKFKKTVTGYIKAYFLLMLLTFFEMLVGLTVLGVEYAFIMAIVISIVDVLPILGTGAVLVPWAIFACLTSNTPLGVGLLILYAVTLVIRQIAEPRIVGSTLGVHPLATLASVYIGLRLVGFVGIFIGPMVAMLIREVFFKHDGEKDVVSK